MLHEAVFSLSTKIEKKVFHHIILTKGITIVLMRWYVRYCVNDIILV